MAGLKALKEIHQRIQQEGRNLFGAAVDELFQECPEIHSLRWTQYTPYFNDGDVCEFSINDVDVRLNLPAQPQPTECYNCKTPFMAAAKFCGHCGKNRPVITEDDEYDSTYSLEKKLGKDRGLKVKEAITLLERDMSSMEDIIKTIFGDHVRVTVSRVGSAINIEIDEHEHE